MTEDIRQQLLGMDTHADTPCSPAANTAIIAENGRPGRRDAAQKMVENVLKCCPWGVHVFISMVKQPHRM